MASRRQKEKPGHDHQKDEEEARIPLQAIVLADSFDSAFEPMSIERAKCLIQIAGAPMIEHTLEWLAFAGVEDAYIACSDHFDEVSNHILNSRFATSGSSSLNATIIDTGESESAADALRNIDSRNVIRSDFILLGADTIANFHIKEALSEHRARRKKNRHCFMTMITRRVAASQRMDRLGEDGTIIAVDTETNRLLHFDDGTNPSVRLETAFFSEHACVEVRGDAQDCSIDICAPELLHSLTDNFDYQHLRRDLVAGTLKEPELGSRIHIHELKRGEYAGKAMNMRAYDAVSRDIALRWSFPHCIDSNLVCATDNSSHKYAVERNCIYKEGNVSIARTATIGPITTIGERTRVGERAAIRGSFIGRGCVIGDGAIVDGSHVLEGAWIGEGSIVMSAMVCNEGCIHSGCTINPGCIVSFQAVIAPNTELHTHACVTLLRRKEGVTGNEEGEEQGRRQKEERSEESLQKERRLINAARRNVLGKGQWDWHEQIVGEGGAGYAWRREEGSSGKQKAEHVLPIAKEKAMAQMQPPEEEQGKAESKAGEEKGKKDKGGEEEKKEASEEKEGERVFMREVGETILRSADRGRSAEESIMVELQGLKLAEERTFADVARFIVITLLGLPLPQPFFFPPELEAMYSQPPPDSKQQQLLLAKKQLLKWSRILNRFLASVDDQVEMLLTIEEYVREDGAFFALGGGEYLHVFPQLMNLLYTIGVLSEDAFLKWEHEKANADEEDVEILRTAEPFLTWLKTAEEEDDDDEEEDEERE